MRMHCCGHMVANTNVSPFAFVCNICCGYKFCVRDTKKVSDFVQKHFVSVTNVSQFAQPQKHHGQQCVRNNVSATMCPQQCVLVYQGLKTYVHVQGLWTSDLYCCITLRRHPSPLHRSPLLVRCVSSLADLREEGRLLAIYFTLFLLKVRLYFLLGMISLGSHSIMWVVVVN